MDWIFIGITATIALYAIGDWRVALYLCIVLDVVRDPIRKVAYGQPAIITVIIAVIWVAMIFGAFHRDRRELLLLFRRYPSFRSCAIALVVALIPGSLVSLVYYNSGWILAAIGFASYSAPLIGIVIGYLWPRSLRDVYRWMTLYTLVNAAFLSGSLLEAYNVEFPGLGGLNMKWVRNYGEDLIPLICGFYRSPDIVGLHSAHVIMFGTMLAIRRGQRYAWFWLSICAWAVIPLILSGRRKMIVVPLIFIVAYGTLWAVYTGRRRIAITLAILASLCFASLQFITESVVSENEYTRFAGSIASEGFERAGRSFTEIIFTTIRQSGVLGDGLGTVTQGRQYMGVVTQTRDWQEDGVGRMFKELGVPGVVFVLISGVLLLKTVRASFDAIPIGHPAGSLQFGFCGVVVANLASFAVSHQAYSGDPSTVLIVGFCCGIIPGLPRTAFVSRPRTVDA